MLSSIAALEDRSLRLPTDRRRSDRGPHAGMTVTPLRCLAAIRRRR